MNKDTPSKPQVNPDCRPPKAPHHHHFPDIAPITEWEMEKRERRYQRQRAYLRRERKQWLAMQPNTGEALGLLLKAKEDNSDLPGIVELRWRERLRRAEERRRKEWIKNHPDPLAAKLQLMKEDWERRARIIRNH